MFRKIFWNCWPFVIFFIYACIASTSSSTLGSVRTPVGIAGDHLTVLIGELGKPFEKWCLTYGEPVPEVFWYRIKSDVMGLVATGNWLKLNITYETIEPTPCFDSEFFANCNLIVRNSHSKYYSKFCCKSCMEAGQLSVHEVPVKYQLARPLRDERLLVRRRNTFHPLCV